MVKFFYLLQLLANTYDYHASRYLSLKYKKGLILSEESIDMAFSIKNSKEMDDILY